MNNQRVILMVLDGCGIAPENNGNACKLAKTPYLDSLRKKYPVAKLCASGPCVGLPKDQPGNSEAGHMNLGAGRVVTSDAVYINKCIENKTFFSNPIFLEGIRYAKKYKSKIHLMGLITENESAHSSPAHWLAILQLLAKEDIKEVYLHLFTDGRDSGQHEAIKIIKRFQQKIIADHNGGMSVKIADICGRFYAMDRAKRWSEVEKAYNLLTTGQCLKAPNAEEAIVEAYNRQETDEFISPTVIEENHKPIATIGDRDVVFFMNLRSDRARELTKAFSQKEFNKENPGSFERKKWSRHLFFIALTDFGPDLDNVRTAYPFHLVKNSLPIVLDGMKQLYIAETEKYAHVTFFFNGGYDHPVEKEERILIPSPDVKNYAKTPAMSIFGITKVLLEKIKQKNNPKFILVNFCNPDMLGHTGNLEAAIKGMEYVDECVSKVVKLAKKEKYDILITADHGNAEEMVNLKTGEIETTHTTNLVNFILISKNSQLQLRQKGILADVSPTILDLMKIKKPREMTGVSLIKKTK